MRQYIIHQREETTHERSLNTTVKMMISIMRHHVRVVDSAADKLSQMMMKESDKLSRMMMKENIQSIQNHLQLN